MNEIHSYFIIYNLTHINSRKTAVGANTVRPNYKGITRKNKNKILQHMRIFNTIKNYSSFTIHYSLFVATEGCSYNPNLTTNISRNNNKLHNRRRLNRQNTNCNERI